MALVENDVIESGSFSGGFPVSDDGWIQLWVFDGQYTRPLGRCFALRFVRSSAK